VPGEPNVFPPPTIHRSGKAGTEVLSDRQLGSGIDFDPRGVRELKGLGEWPVYAIVGFD